SDRWAWVVGVWWCAGGCLVFCLFLVTVLIPMPPPSAITSEQEAMALMDALHRQLGWLVVLFAVITISTGFVSLLSELQDREARARRLVESNIIGVFMWVATVGSSMPMTPICAS